MIRPLLGAMLCAGLGLLLLAVPGRVLADLVVMKDGRQVEGNIVADSPTEVRIDTRISSIRTTLRLFKSDIERIDKLPLPAGFFDQEEKAEERVSKPADTAGATTYIEVPIAGRFGTNIVPKGVERCLTYASTHKINHVVFIVDSHGGDQIAAKQIYDLLARFDKQLTYHAVVRDAVGVAMAIPVFCDNIMILPGASMGGVSLSLEGRKGDPDVVLAQVAHEIAGVAEGHGWSRSIVQAMIDPAVAVSAWRAGDKVEFGEQAPEGATPILQDGADTLLTLTRAQAIDIGRARAFEGDAAQLGSVLGIEAWKRESDYGEKTMADAARKEEQKLAKNTARLEKKMTENLKKRELTKSYIERALDASNGFNEELTTYGTYKDSRGTWEAYWGDWGGPQRSTITKTQWRKMVDDTVGALKAAGNGVMKMKKLDKEAVDLGLSPSFEPGQLDQMQTDLEEKINLLLKHREHPGSLEGGESK